MNENKDYAELLEKNKDEIKAKVRWFIKYDVYYRAKNPSKYHVSKHLASMLETFAGADVKFPAPYIWKRKATCELIDDPELNALAAEIVRHEQEDFDGIDPEDYREGEESNEVKIHDCWEWHE